MWGTLTTTILWMLAVVMILAVMLGSFPGIPLRRGTEDLGV